MFHRKRNSTSPRWPFWLLLGAWFCANCPQVAIFTALTWLTESRSFTHQQRLTLDVAHVLGGEKPSRPIAEAVARAQERIPANPLPPVSGDTVLKKIQLSLERTVDLLPPALRASHPIIVTLTCIDTLRVRPPHEPPRAGLVT